MLRMLDVRGERAMDMRDEWLIGVRAWAGNNGNVRELWLFGSRATGRARPVMSISPSR
jgi:predicted nucleotidyltransferase